VKIIAMATPDFHRKRRTSNAERRTPKSEPHWRLLRWMLDVGRWTLDVFCSEARHDADRSTLDAWVFQFTQ